MSFPSEAAYPEASQSTTALVLAIFGIVCCGPLAIVGWVMANKELEGIASGHRNPQNEGTAKAARVVGIVGTVLFGISIVVGILAVTGAIFLPFFER